MRFLLLMHKPTYPPSGNIAINNLPTRHNFFNLIGRFR